jgi:hypothetical protein
MLALSVVSQTPKRRADRRQSSFRLEGWSVCIAALSRFDRTFALGRPPNELDASKPSSSLRG